MAGQDLMRRNGACRQMRTVTQVNGRVGIGGIPQYMSGWKQRRGAEIQGFDEAAGHVKSIMTVAAGGCRQHNGGNDRYGGYHQKTMAGLV
jgi:hypothetical protein